MTGALSTAALVIAAVAGARGTWSPCGLSMVSAINPLSERSRGNRYSLTAAWFVLGSVLGGLALGAASSLLAFAAGPLPTSAALWLGLVACLVAVAADRRLAGFHLPLHPRQVNELWLTQYRRWIYAAGFGAQIGLGFATYIMTAATYLMVVLAVLAGSPALAVATGVTFGLVRGLAVLLSARCRSAQSLQRLHRVLSRLEPASLKAAVLAEGLAAGGLGYAVAGPPAGTCTLLGVIVLQVTTDPWVLALLRRARTGQPDQYVAAE